jgi:glucose/arabinose dehydrogenase
MRSASDQIIAFTSAGAMLALTACGGGSPSSPPPPVFVPVTLGVTRVFPALSFNMPVGALQAPGDASRWFIVEQGGKVRVFANQAGTSSASDFIDLSTRVTCCGETGLLGLAFHPGFPANPQVYLSYTTTVGGQLVSRLAQFRSVDGGVTLDPSSERVLMEIDQPQNNHNGGHILFGPDGYLYFGLGDGGGAGDAHGTIGNGQDLNTLLGKMLRIDVDSPVMPYGIPADNPYATDAACGNTGGTGRSMPGACAIPGSSASILRVERSGSPMSDRICGKRLIASAHRPTLAGAVARARMPTMRTADRAPA